MKNFNKYNFLNGLELEIEESSKDGYLNNDDEVQQYIDDAIDNECIYYSNCFEIMKELNLYSWDDFDVECKNVTQVAYQGLSEYVMENIEYNYFKKV